MTGSTWLDIDKYVNFSSLNGDIDVHFFNIKDRLLEFIEKSECLVGCVAWLTDFDIISSLNRKSALSMVVNKTAALDKKQKASLMPLVGEGNSSLGPGPGSDLRYHMDPQKNGQLDKIRCIGFAGEKYAPIMHHKFLVSLKSNPNPSNSGELWVHGESVNSPLRAEAVWTGSYNFTNLASEKHLENVVMIKDLDIARRFFCMWEQIYIRSESMTKASNTLDPDQKFDDAAFEADYAHQLDKAYVHDFPDAHWLERNGY